MLFKNELEGTTPTAKPLANMGGGGTGGDAEDITAIDTEGLVGTAGGDSDVQALLDEIADRVVSKLLQKDGSILADKLAIGTLGTVGSSPANLGEKSLSVGTGNFPSGSNAIVHGDSCQATGNKSFAGGHNASATAQNTFAHGYNISVGYENQSAVGKYNNNKSTSLFEVGNGTSASAKNNAFEVHSDGHAKFDGRVEQGSSDFLINASSDVAIEESSTGTASRNYYSYTYIFFKDLNKTCIVVRPISRGGSFVYAASKAQIGNDGNIVPAADEDSSWGSMSTPGAINKLKMDMVLNYIPWTARSNVQVNSTGKIPTSALVYAMNQNLGDPSSASAVTGDDAFSKIGQLSSDLASKITGVWTNITASSPSDKVDIIPTDQYRTSGYVVRGGLCFVNISIQITADTGDNSTVVLSSGVLPSPLRVYNGQYSTYKTPSWSSFGTPSNQIFAESLFQNGILYIRKAVAGDYSISFVYPVASP